MDKDVSIIHTHTHTHIHTQWNTTQPEKGMNLPIATKMNGSTGYYAKMKCYTGKDKYHLISFICGVLKNKGTSKSKQRQMHRYREQMGSCQRGGEWRVG